MHTKLIEKCYIFTYAHLNICLLFKIMQASKCLQMHLYTDDYLQFLAVNFFSN
jgi:hypothetical protein